MKNKKKYKGFWLWYSLLCFIVIIFISGSFFALYGYSYLIFLPIGVLGLWMAIGLINCELEEIKMEINELKGKRK